MDTGDYRNCHLSDEKKSPTTILLWIILIIIILKLLDDSDRINSIRQESKKPTTGRKDGKSVIGAAISWNQSLERDCKVLRPWAFCSSFWSEQTGMYCIVAQWRKVLSKQRQQFIFKWLVKALLHQLDLRFPHIILRGETVGTVSRSKT